MKRALLFLSALLTLQLAGTPATDLNNVAVNNAKIPFYNRNTLQTMIFADKAEYRAQLLYGRNVIINMLRKQVDPDRIRDDWNLKFYPLKSSLREIASFWSPRINYCDAVLYTPEGALNQSERSAAGDKEIKMRSPLFDLDGVGFAADFKRRQIKVNSNVHFVLRNQNCDPRNFSGKLPARYEYIFGSADMLHMDTAKHRLLLLGKVNVSDGKMQLSCDRLTLLLGEDKKHQDKSTVNFSGIRMINADGNVKISKVLPPGAPASEEQEMTGDHLVYDVLKEQMTMTGDRTPPAIRNGKGMFLRGKQLVFFRKTQQMIVPRECRMELEQNGQKRYLLSDYANFKFDTGTCDFLGHVRGSAPQHEFACAKMRIYLQRKSDKSAKKVRPENSAVSPLSSAGDVNTGSMEFKRMLCKDNVQLFRRETKGVSTMRADEAELDYITDKAYFRGNVNCNSAGNTLETERLTVNLKKSAADPEKREVENAEAPEKIKITSAPSAKGVSSVITADKGFFDYKADRIDFIGNVLCKQENSSLESDLLELFLGAADKGNAPVSIPGVAAGASGSSRTLKRAVATGNAVMKDGKHDLKSEKIQYFFAPALPGAVNQPGLFQSGSLRLIRVECDGSVKLTDAQKTEPAVGPVDARKTAPEKNPGALLGRNTGFRELKADRLVTDLIKQTTVLTDNVSLSDGGSRMDCEKLSLFAKVQKAVQTVGKNGQTDPDADPDADPFAIQSENSVPSSVILGNGLELDRAIASENVVIDRKKPGSTDSEKLYCDQALFDSSKMTVECTSADGRRPKVEGMGKTHFSDKFTIHLKDERIESSGEGMIL